MKDKAVRNNSVRESSVKRAIKFWLYSTKDNLKVAEVMFESGRWNFSMFMCQQTIEALLKAVIITETKERPPYLHDLVLLSKACKIELEEEVLNVLIEANKHYIEARYKEVRFNPKIYNRESAKYLFEETKKIIKWFTKKTNLNL